MLNNEKIILIVERRGVEPLIIKKYIKPWPTFETYKQNSTYVAPVGLPLRFALLPSQMAGH